MSKVPRTINFNEKMLKDLESNKFDPNKKIFEVKKERIALIIACFEGLIKDLDDIPQQDPRIPCILTCAYFQPSIFTLQLINEYHSTKRVLLTYRKNGNDLKILTYQDSLDSIKLHDDFGNLHLATSRQFDSQCRNWLKQRVHGSKKLTSIFLNTEEFEHLVRIIRICKGQYNNLQIPTFFSKISSNQFFILITTAS